jgi:hypothetical protein
MSDTISTSIEIDTDELVDAIVNTRNFSSGVEGVIDDYDFSYTFDNAIESALEDVDFIDKDNFNQQLLKALQDSEDIRDEISYLLPSRSNAEVVDFSVVGEALALCHKALGNLSQQIAIINAMCGASVWPNATTEPLMNLYTKIEALGYKFDNTSTTA